jgi:hypothetical protein
MQPFGKRNMTIADANMEPAEINGDAQRMRKRKLLMGILLLLACIATVRVTLSLTAHGLRSPWLACALVIAEYAGGYALLSLDKITGTIFLGTTGALFSLGTGLLSGIFGFSVLADPLKADVPMLYSLLPSFLFNLAFLFSAVRYQSAIQADVKAANFAVGCGSALIIPWFFWKYILGY